MHRNRTQHSVAEVAKALAFIQSIFSAVECVFSLLEVLFSDRQHRALADYIRTSLMLNYNRRLAQEAQS